MDISDRRIDENRLSARFSVEKDEFFLRAEDYLRRSQFQEALLLAKERARLHPGDFDALLVSGIALLKSGREEEAAAAFEEIREGILRLSVALEYLGDIYAGRGETEQARGCYRSLAGIDDDPELVERVLRKLDSLDEMDMVSDDAAAGEIPADFETLTVAELFLKQGYLEQAAKVLASLSLREPDNEKVRKLLEEVSARLAEKEEPLRPEAAVIAELDRWLHRLLKLRQDGYQERL